MAHQHLYRSGGLKERKDEDEDEEGESSEDDDGDGDESGAIKKFNQDELHHLQGDEDQTDDANPPRNASRIRDLEIKHEGDHPGTTHDLVADETTTDRSIKREASPGRHTPIETATHAPVACIDWKRGDERCYREAASLSRAVAPTGRAEEGQGV